jgi:hypothetical protein
MNGSIDIVDIRAVLFLHMGDGAVIRDIGDSGRETEVIRKHACTWRIALQAAMGS